MVREIWFSCKDEYKNIMHNNIFYAGAKLNRNENVCNVTPFAPTHVHHSLLTMSLLGQWSTSGSEGVTHISLPLQEYDRGSGRKREGQTNKHEQCLGLTQSRRRVCNTTCMCGLTLAWVTSENSTSNWNADIFWLNLFRWTLSYLLLSPESTASVHGSTPTLCWLASLLSRRQLPLSSFVQLTLFRVPLPLPDTARFQVKKSFVWFRAKTDNEIVCLAGHPYSVTCIKNEIQKD